MPHITQQNWIFDMDGTLTIAKHDFDAIRTALGLPEGLPILESLAQLPAEKSIPLHQQLNEIELEVAKRSEPAPYAAQLLQSLTARGANIGILTRNNAQNIHVTLEAAGLLQYFSSENLLSRECATPKPAPDGIFQLLNKWQADTQDAVMVGDYIHDLAAGRNAQVTTIYVDHQGLFPFKASADICVQSLAELLD